MRVCSRDVARKRHAAAPPLDAGLAQCPECRDPITKPGELRAAVREYQAKMGMCANDFRTRVASNEETTLIIHMDEEDGGPEEDDEDDRLPWRTMEHYPETCAPLFAVLLAKTGIDADSFDVKSEVVRYRR